ncbi:glycosyltransferase [Lachnospiraceae bacterium ZAX-1]
MKTGKHSGFYIKLGQAYEMKNPNQAYLCYENALHYCANAEEETAVHVAMNVLKTTYEVTIAKIAIVLLSYNNQQLTKDCILSIRQNNHPSTYELIVVDNASFDGIREWLLKQEHIKLILNEENKGFPHGCNQGIAAADQDSDILLLNNDTIVPCDALFWLRMGLYEHDNIGAAGSVSNEVPNYQQVEESFDTIAEWLDYADNNNHPMQYPYEKKGWLVGFALLIRRVVLDQVGLLDVRFSPGNYEDNDLCIRILQKGYQLLLCKNSFIYHYGSKSFGKRGKEKLKLLLENEAKLTEKYGFNYIPYSFVDSSILKMIQPKGQSCTVLEIGCKMGCTLARLQSKYPEIQVVGIEHNEKLRMIAKQVTNVREDMASFHENMFDYIILDKTILAEGDPLLLLQIATQLLKETGSIIVSLKNTQCMKKFASDKEERSIRLEEMTTIFAQAGLWVRQCNYRAAVLTAKQEEELRKQAGGNADEITLGKADTFIFEIQPFYLSVCIITKNEEKNIEKCLRHLQPYGFELVVVDTGSTDNTKEVATRYTERIFDFKWCDDFAAAKNFAIQQAVNEYVMVIDSDEYIKEFNINEFKTNILNNTDSVGRIKRINTYEKNGLQEESQEYINRIFSKKLFRYEGTIHEQLVRIDGNAYRTYVMDVALLHSGYDLSAEQRKQKTKRNIAMLEAEIERKGTDPYFVYQLGKSYYMAGDYERAAQYFEQGLSYDLNPALTYVVDMVETYGYALINSKQYHLALSFEGIYETFGKTADFQFLMGLIYMHNAMYDEAITQFLKAVQQKECTVKGVNSYSSYYNIGVIHECRNHVEEARRYYEKAGNYKPAKERLSKLI